jgi:hypothetical protein
MVGRLDMENPVAARLGLPCAALSPRIGVNLSEEWPETVRSLGISTREHEIGTIFKHPVSANQSSSSYSQLVRAAYAPC